MTSTTVRRLLVAGALLLSVLAFFWLTRERTGSAQPVVSAKPMPTPATLKEVPVTPSAPSPAPGATAVNSLNAPAPAPAHVVQAATNQTAPIDAVAVQGEPTPLPADPVKLEENTAASERMYVAHAPLRTPEIADPDSASNRQILQAMVMKAIARQNEKVVGSSN